MELHTNDLSINSEKTLREQLIDNFQLISKEVGQLEGEFTALNNQHTADVTAIYKAIQQARDELSVAITNYEKVTDDRLEKIEKMLYGNDPQSIEHTEPADVLDGVKIVEINK